MPTLRVRCPDCDASLRQPVEPVDEPTNVELTCPKCGAEFVAVAEPAEPDEAPRRQTKKPQLASRRRNDDGRDERPRRKPGARSNTRLVVACAAGGVLLVLGVVLAVALSDSKGKETAKADPPAKQQPKTQPAPRPNPNTAPAPAPDPLAAAVGTVPPGGLPAGGEPVEDVFARATGFRPDGPLPELPPLPPVERRPILTLDPGGHTAFIRHVFFTPSNQVITVGEDKAVRWWDVMSGEPVGVIRLPAGPDKEGTPYAAAISPDGKRLAVGGFPLNRGKSGIPIYLLSTDTGKLDRVVTGAREVPRSCDFTPDGTRLAVACGNGFVQVIEIETGKKVYEVRGHPGDIRHVRFNPKLPLVSSVGRENDVKIWSLDDPTAPVATLRLGDKAPSSSDWTSDGKTLAVGCTSGELFLYDPAGKHLKTVPAIKEKDAPIQIARMKFLPDDKRVVFGGVCYSGWAGVIDVQTGERPVLVREHTNTVATVTCSADGLLAASCGGEFNETLVWTAADGAVGRRFAAATRGLWAVGWGRDGKSLAWGTTNRHTADGLSPLDTTLRLDDFSTGGSPDPAAFQQHVREDRGMSVKMDDFYHFTASENGKPLYQHKSLGEGNRIYSVSILPGKGILVGASFSMYLLDARTGNPLRRFLGDTGLTTAVAPSPDGRYFVTASSDQVVRVWAAEQPEPLLSIFPVGREWIAWTPQGYYACSAYGERLVGWQVNKGTDKLPEVHPAVRFRPSMFQPAVLKYLIPAGNLQLALAMAARFDRQSATATGLADVLPPTVTVTAPPTAEAEVAVGAVAEGNGKHPVVAMRLLVDGRPYQGAAGVQRFAPGREKAEASWKVALSPGPHSLAVLAESAVSKGLSAPVVVTRAGKEELPNLYVFAAGVSDYPGDMKLNFAASDAQLLTTTLAKHAKGVFGAVEVKTLTDKEATKRGMLEGLDWLRSKMTSKDVGIFSFSGHGGRDPRTGQFFLVPVDVSDADPVGSCMSGDEFKSRLENMPGRLIAILDACHSGAAASSTKPNPNAGRPDNLVRDLLTDDYGVIVLSSSLGHEYSMESPITKAGFFTLGLTEGLTGRADINRDGLIYINELSYYAALRVGQLSGGRQNPTLGRPPTIRPFPIAKP